MYEDEVKEYDPEKERQNMLKKRNATYLVRLLDEDPGKLYNIKALLDYRGLRVEQCIYPMLIEEAKQDPNSQDINIEMMRNRVERLDRQRREYHNKALGCYYGLIKAMKSRGIPTIYSGELMDPNKEPDHYGDPNVRAAMTDSFLGLLSTIEDININELNIDREDYEKGLSTFEEIRKTVSKQTREYGATILEDDGELINKR